MSRIYGGIHFLFSDTAGLTAGGDLGAYVLQTFSTSSDQTPPTITLTSPSTGSVTTSSNITITGHGARQPLGRRSRCEAQVDGGAFAPVSFDAQGNFSLTTTFATDGTADGAHTIGFQATDVAGNVTQLVDVADDARHQGADAHAHQPDWPATLTDGDAPLRHGRRHRLGDHRPVVRRSTAGRRSRSPSARTARSRQALDLSGAGRRRPHPDGHGAGRGRERDARHGRSQPGRRRRR